MKLEEAIAKIDECLKIHNAKPRLKRLFSFSGTFLLGGERHGYEKEIVETAKSIAKYELIREAIVKDPTMRIWCTECDALRKFV